MKCVAHMLILKALELLYVTSVIRNEQHLNRILNDKSVLKSKKFDKFLLNYTFQVALFGTQLCWTYNTYVFSNKKQPASFLWSSIMEMDITMIKMTRTEGVNQYWYGCKWRNKKGVSGNKALFMCNNFIKNEKACKIIDQSCHCIFSQCR